MRKKGVKKTSSTRKKHRKLSEYNKFVQKKMEAGKSMEQAAEAWRKHKEKLEEPKAKKTTPKIKLKQSTELEEVLVKNLIELQKIHTGLAEKFDKLSKEISNILALFEITAKSFTKSVPMGEYEKDKDFLDKIDKLLDQNKTLAKGLMLMEERLKERVYGSQPHQALEPENFLEESIKKPLAAGKRPLPRF